MPNPWEPDFPTEEQPYFEYQEWERPWEEAQQRWDLLQPDPWEYGQGRNGDPWEILGPQANWAEDSPAEWLGVEGDVWPSLDPWRFIPRGPTPEMLWEMVQAGGLDWAPSYYEPRRAGWPRRQPEYNWGYPEYGWA